MPHDEKGRPSGRGGLRDARPGEVDVISTVSSSGSCPCGCLTRLPYVDDPECVRHRPLTYDYGLYESGGVPE